MKILIIILCIVLLFRNKKEGKKKRTGAWQAVKRLIRRKADKRYRKQKKQFIKSGFG
jgi:hypothetical protein